VSFAHSFVLIQFVVQDVFLVFRVQVGERDKVVLLAAVILATLWLIAIAAKRSAFQLFPD
jgi:hypothetical protein